MLIGCIRYSADAHTTNSQNNATLNASLSDLLATAPTVTTTTRPPITFQSFFVGVGSMWFSYGGHAGFPTIQQDMRRPGEFGRSVIIAYICVVIMYALTTIVPYALLPLDKLSADDLLGQFGEQRALSIVGNCVLFAQTILGIVIMINVVNQEAEERVGIRCSECS